MNLNEMFDLKLLEGRYDPFVFKSIFVCGAPGSGKTTIERRLGLQTLGLKRLDLDRTMYFMRSRNNSQQVDYCRAGDIAEKTFHTYIGEKLGLIIHTTGRNEANVIRMDNNLRSYHYNTLMIYVDVEQEIARQRIESRANISDDPADRGRKVDTDYFEQAYTATHDNIPLYEHLFGENFVAVKNEGGEVDAKSFDTARRKINAFLHAPVSPEANVFLKGVSHPRKHHQQLGKRFVS